MKYKDFLTKILLAAALAGSPSVAFADEYADVAIQSDATQKTEAAAMTDQPLTAGDFLAMSPEMRKNYIITQLGVVMMNLRSPNDLQGNPKSPEMMTRHQQYYADLWDWFYNPDKPSNGPDGNPMSGLLANFMEANPKTPAADVFKGNIGKVLDLYAERRAKAASAPPPNNH